MTYVLRSAFLLFCLLTGGLVIQVSAQSPKSLGRGPYLQKTTPTGITLRWRTNPASVGTVRYGSSVGQLTQSVSESTANTDHEVTLTGLTPDTQYFYSVGTPETALQGDSTNYFYTFPVEGTARKTRIWSLGDFGNGSARQANVKKAFKNYVERLGNPHIDLWLWLGDNAYNRGLDKEFQSYVFSTDNGYGGDRFMKQTPIFATPGNHDYAGNDRLRLSLDIPYYQIVSNPTKAEAGGVPSGTESYYSFNYGNIHFVSLDSDRYEDSTSRAAGIRFDAASPQLAWLKQDLAATQNNPNITWTIAIWHHPPYTKGTHDSDTEHQLRNVRTNLLPVLEQYNVDLVMCGHSHVYERSKLLKGHYGDANTFDAKTHTRGEDAQNQESAQPVNLYQVKHAPATRHEGTIYVVNGDGGAEGGHVSKGSALWPHPAMAVSYDGTGGSMYIEIEGNILTAIMIAGDGSIQDQFTIRK